MQDEAFDDDIEQAAESLDAAQCCELQAADFAVAALFDEWLSTTEPLVDSPEVSGGTTPGQLGSDCFERLLASMDAIREFARSRIQSATENLAFVSTTGADQEQPLGQISNHQAIEYPNQLLENESLEEPDLIEESVEPNTLGEHCQVHREVERPDEQQLHSAYGQELGFIEQLDEQPPQRAVAILTQPSVLERGGLGQDGTAEFEHGGDDTPSSGVPTMEPACLVIEGPAISLQWLEGVGQEPQHDATSTVTASVGGPLSLVEPLVIERPLTLRDEPLPTVRDEPLPTVRDEPLPTVRDEPLLTARHEPLPTVRHEPLPTVRHEPLPTVRHEPLPTVRHEPLPTVRHDPLPTVRHDPLPTVRHEPLPTVRHEPLPTVRHEPLPTVRHEPLPTVRSLRSSAEPGRERRNQDDDTSSRTARLVDVPHRPLLVNGVQPVASLPTALVPTHDAGFTARVRSSSISRSEASTADRTSVSSLPPALRYVGGPAAAKELIDRQLRSRPRIPTQTRELLGAEIALGVLLAVSAVARQKAQAEVPVLNLTISAAPQQLAMASAGATPARKIHAIVQGQNLKSVAESLWGDSEVAWLIAELNIGQTRQEVFDTTLVVEIKAGTPMILPSAEDVRHFYERRLPSQLTNLVTIVTENAFNEETIQALSSAMGCGATSRPGYSPLHEQFV